MSDDASMRHNEHDMRLIVPLMIVMIVLVAWLVFRRVLFALIPLAVVLVALIWMFELFTVLWFTSKATLLVSTLRRIITPKSMALSASEMVLPGRCS